jgi:hypothetical protein
MFTQLFEHLLDVRVLLCRLCAVAIPPAQVVTHLKARHPKISVARRKDVAAIVQELPNLAWVPTDVRVPAADQEPIPGLPTPVDGLVCSADRCQYVCRTRQGIQGHCKDEHGWIISRRRGGDARQKSKHPRRCRLAFVSCSHEEQRR